MVFLTAMAAIFLADYLGKVGVIYGFVIAISMEVINLIIITRSTKSGEDAVRDRYKKIIAGYKMREQSFEEVEASLKRSNEALEKQLQEYIEKINGLEIQLREKRKMVEIQREKIDQQQKVLAAVSKPTWD